jgi:hypothetical protein
MLSHPAVYRRTGRSAAGNKEDLLMYATYPPSVENEPPDKNIAVLIVLHTYIQYFTYVSAKIGGPKLTNIYIISNEREHGMNNKLF